jgi:hypothetical protein
VEEEAICHLPICLPPVLPRQLLTLSPQRNKDFATQKRPVRFLSVEMLAGQGGIVKHHIEIDKKVTTMISKSKVFNFD